MGLVSGIVVYICIWWTVIFCVLPVGLATHYEEQGDHVAPGAPSSVNMTKKLIITTLISFVIWLIVYLMIDFDVFSFRQWANSG